MKLTKQKKICIMVLLVICLWFGYNWAFTNKSVIDMPRLYIENMSSGKRYYAVRSSFNWVYKDGYHHYVPSLVRFQTMTPMPDRNPNRQKWNCMIYIPNGDEKFHLELNGYPARGAPNDISIICFPFAQAGTLVSWEDGIPVPFEYQAGKYYLPPPVPDYVYFAKFTWDDWFIEYSWMYTNSEQDYHIYTG